jgi:hypothetical protein
MGAAPHVVLDLWVYLPVEDTASFVTYFSLQPGDALPLGLTHHGDPDWFLSSAPCCAINVWLTTPPLAGAWNHMSLDVVYDTRAGSAALSYEGVDRQPHTVTFDGPTALNVPAAVTASVGMDAPGATEAPFAAYYDNIVVTTP